MPVHADVVIVENMRRDAVDQRGVACRQIASAGDLRRAVIAGRGRHHLRDKLHGRLVGARDHGADAIEHADARAVVAALRHRRRLDRGDEFRDVGRQRGHEQLLCGAGHQWRGKSCGTMRHPTA
jgi:hypothetical protein